MKVLSWFLLAILLVLAGCASGSTTGSQRARLLLSPTAPGTVTSESYKDDATLTPLSPWEKYNLVYYRLGSF